MGESEIDGFEELERAYAGAAPGDLVLFLGAGVNLPPTLEAKKTARYATFFWEELLRKLYQRNRGRQRASYEELKAECGGDWLDLASAILEGVPIERSVGQLDALIYNRGRKTIRKGKKPRNDEIRNRDKYGRLRKSFLDQAPTLHAAICLTAKIRQPTVAFTFEPNPRFAAVATFNYDFFFGAGWTRYQCFRSWWKVQTPHSEDPEPDDKRPVYYLHGYLPYRRGEPRQVVLTRESYQVAYVDRDFTRKVLKRLIRAHTVLFVGTSFDDAPLRTLLRTHGRERRHFALVTPRGLDRVADLPVTPVVARDYQAIPDVLRRVYLAGLTPAECRRVGLPHPDAYWARLQQGPIK